MTKLEHTIRSVLPERAHIQLRKNWSVRSASKSDFDEKAASTLGTMG